MASSENTHHCAIAKIVNISQVKKHRSGRSSHETRAFVEFTDYNGEPATSSFTIYTTPLYTTLRIGHTVEIEYWEQAVLGGYASMLLNEERYDRTPTEEELAPYNRNRKRVNRQSLMGVLAFFGCIMLCAITHSPLFLLLLVVLMFPIMKYGSKEAGQDHDKFPTWSSEEPNE